MLETNVPTIVDPEKCNLAEAQEREFNIAIIHMLKYLKENIKIEGQQPYLILPVFHFLSIYLYFLNFNVFFNGKICPGKTNHLQVYILQCYRTNTMKINCAQENHEME